MKTCAHHSISSLKVGLKSAREPVSKTLAFCLKNHDWREDVALRKYALYLLLVNHGEIDSLYRRGRLELSLQVDWITSHYRFEVIGTQPMFPFSPHSKHILKSIFHVHRHSVATETPESCHIGSSALWRLRFDFQVIQIKTEISVISVQKKKLLVLHTANNKEKGEIFPKNGEKHTAYFHPKSYKHVPILEEEEHFWQSTIPWPL